MKHAGKARLGGLFVLFLVTSVFFFWESTRAQSGSSLDLITPGVQLMNYYYDYNNPAIGHRIYQHVFKNGAYQEAWRSGPLPYQAPDLPGHASVRIGDIDNDGQREVVASNYYVTLREKVKRTLVDHTDFRICVYKNGCVNEAVLGDMNLIVSPPLGEIEGTIIIDSAIGDADNGSVGEPHNELVLARTFQVDIWRYSSPGTYETIGRVSGYLRNVEIGDADNDGKNEIVCTSQGSCFPVIFKQDELGQWYKMSVEALGSQYFGPGHTYLDLFYAKVREADNDGQKEIIACGNNGRLMVWKYDKANAAWTINFIGDYLGVNTAGAIDAGDIDGLGRNEILLSVWGERKYSPRIYRYSYDWTSHKYILVASYISPNSVGDLVLGDLDGDKKPEVGLNRGTSGLYVFGFSGANLAQVYTAPSEAGKIEIK